MPSTFQLEVMTPERKFYSGNVEMVIIPAVDGSLGILAEHEPMVTAISIGELKIKVSNEWKIAAISNGFIEIMPNHCIILADTVEWPNEIDAERARHARERAEERLLQQQSRIEYLRTQAAIRRALTRLRVTQEIK